MAQTPEQTKRNNEIFEKRTRSKDPMTYRALSLEYGLSIQRIQQIVQKAKMRILEDQVNTQ